MNEEFYKGATEAVLFAVAEPVSATKIADALGIETSKVNGILKALTEEYDKNERAFAF